MEKQLVEALKGVNKISDLDEVSKDMIMCRARVVLEKAHSIMDKFVNDFQELVDNDEELCHLMGITCVFAYSDDYCKLCAAEEGNPDKAIKTTVIYGSKQDTQLLHMQLMVNILKDRCKHEEEGTNDED